jgi:tetratricopeptide (TPR) repeat protein/transcriptional regulator with XRE-family HTH domain
VADQAPVTFGALLRQLRTEAGLTQEELAAAATVSTRSVSDLERAVNLTARKDTARLLADALHLVGSARAEFEEAARGRAVPFEAASTGLAAATRTLPRDIASFTGRQQELEQLVEAVSGAGGVVGIHAIGGMAGVGKTAFAVHVAHKLADRFPGGQIFLPLHGHTPGQRPVDPADALASLLASLGVQAGQIPQGLEARMALWRDRLAGKQLLLVLDDAASSEQVSPLLPGSGGSLVLVTSRRHLSALDDATAVSLDTLPAHEAAALLVRLAARPGLTSADPAVGEIIRLCGYLPLAIGMVARQLHHHPAWTAAGQAAELAAAVDRLELMATENLSVAAAFDLSYRDLTGDQQRLFRRLGLHPGTDIDAYALAALYDTDMSTARSGLEALYDQYLLNEPVRGRYRLHDLIREYARTLTIRDDPDNDQERAVNRLLDYYVTSAAIADRRLTRYTRPGQPIRLSQPPPAPDLPDITRALAWARTERANLMACLDYVINTGQRDRISALVASIAALLRHDGPWNDAIRYHVAAVEAARFLGDRLSEANALNDLAVMRYLTGAYAEAARDLEMASGIYTSLGDRQGQANVLSNQGGLRRLAGDYRDAADKLEVALELSRNLGDMRGQARALNELALISRMTGDYARSAQASEEALHIARDLGDLRGQAGSQRILGIARYLTGDYVGASEVLDAALNISRHLDDWQGQADVLFELGIVRRLTEDYAGAAAALEVVLDISRRLGDRGGQANALGVLGGVLRLVGDHQGAGTALEAALEILRELGDRGGEVEILNEMGELRRVRGEVEQAKIFHQQALSLAREIDAPGDQAYALAGLGRCSLAVGDIAGAEAGLRHALEIFQRIGDAESAHISAELLELGAAAQPGPADSLK